MMPVSLALVLGFAVATLFGGLWVAAMVEDWLIRRRNRK